jgi:hypothetical protein
MRVPVQNSSVEEDEEPAEFAPYYAPCRLERDERYLKMNPPSNHSGRFVLPTNPN